MQTIYIDISNKGVIQPVYAKQGDIGRKFIAAFMENGGRYNIPSGSMFSAWYKGASGEGNYTDVGDKSAFSVANSRVTVELITEMLSVPGEGFICLVLTKSDGGQIGSWNIPYICEEVPGFGSEEVTQYFTAFSKALEDIRSNPENIHIDNSLSMDGSAADAAAVGLKVQEHDNLIADNAVEIAMLKEKVESGGITDEEFAAKVEEKVVFELQSGSGEIFDNVLRISANISDESLYNAGLVENDEDGNPIYFPDRRDNPNQVTAEQVGAVAEEQLAEKVANIIAEDVNNGGVINDSIYSVAESAAYPTAELVAQDYELLGVDEDGNLVRNVPTYEEVDEQIGNIEIALDSIIAIQTQLIGGVGV